MAKLEEASAKTRSVAADEALEVPFSFKNLRGIEEKYLITGIPMGRLIKPKKRSGWGIMATQGSPFHDDIQANWIVTIRHATSKTKVLTIDALTPHLMYRYGFYQGGFYRKSGPQDIAKFFGLNGS